MNFGFCVLMMTSWQVPFNETFVFFVEALSLDANRGKGWCFSLFKKVSPEDLKEMDCSHHLPWRIYPCGYPEEWRRICPYFHDGSGPVFPMQTLWCLMPKKPQIAPPKWQRCHRSSRILLHELDALKSTERDVVSCYIHHFILFILWDRIWMNMGKLSKTHQPKIIQIYSIRTQMPLKSRVIIAHLKCFLEKFQTPTICHQTLELSKPGFYTSTRHLPDNPCVFFLGSEKVMNPAKYIVANIKHVIWFGSNPLPKNSCHQNYHTV